jgi:hypothetical protein
MSGDQVFTLRGLSTEDDDPVIENFELQSVSEEYQACYLKTAPRGAESVIDIADQSPEMTATESNHDDDQVELAKIQEWMSPLIPSMSPLIPSMSPVIPILSKREQ